VPRDHDEREREQGEGHPHADLLVVLEEDELADEPQRAEGEECEQPASEEGEGRGRHAEKV
jgi:hypothetical protein